MHIVEKQSLVYSDKVFYIAMENEIVIRKVTKEDCRQLSQLYERVWPDVTFDKQAKAAFVIEESEGVSYCAVDKGKIVGSRTSFYVNMYYGDKLINCVQFADSCTESAYRGKGLFLKLNHAFLKDFFERGELVYNISVYASKKAYEKLGWHYIKSLMFLRKLQKPLRALWKVRGDVRRLGGDIMWDMDSPKFTIPEPLLEARENLFSTSPLLHVRYETNTIAWRQKSKNGMKCLIDEQCGAIIYKIGNKEGLRVVEIGEMFLKCYDQGCFDIAIKRINQDLNPDMIIVMVSLGHPLLQFYRKRHFLKNPKQEFLYQGTRVESEEMRKIAEDPHAWAISSLDIDTF